MQIVESSRKTAHVPATDGDGVNSIDTIS